MALNNTMGGLDVLVAAASAANSSSNGNSNATKRKRVNDSQVDSSTFTAQNNPVMPAQPLFNGQASSQAFNGNGAPSIGNDQNNQHQSLLNILSNPIFLHSLASTVQSMMPGANPSSPYTQIQPQQDGTTYETRFGRISRPPAQNDFTQMFAQNSTSVFDPMLGSVTPAGELDFIQQDSNWGAQTLADASADDGSLSPRQNADGLPIWPLPPTGRGGRKQMPKDEMLARRRARNRLAAIESRKKRKSKINEMENNIQSKEMGYLALQQHCKKLEQQVEQLKQVIASAGLTLPPDLPTPDAIFTPAAIPSMPTLDFTNQLDDTPFSTDALPPLDMFFTADFMDEAEDGDFLPPSSPIPSDAGKKGKKRAREEDDDEEFSDDDVEDEDLFLPIEDVPVPPDAQIGSAMRSLGVDSQEQLAELVNKMVTAGKDGMTPEMVDKLKVLVGLVGPNGDWAVQ